MKLRITQLKAPWPQGANVGDVVEVDAPLVPAWAAGKCDQVGDDEVATVAYSEPQESKADPATVAKPKK